MKAKIFTLLFGCVMITFGSMAQNFKTFTIDGALTIGAMRKGTDAIPEKPGNPPTPAIPATPGSVEVVVSADFDLTKCMVHYELDAAGGEIDPTTPLANNSVVDLSAPKTILMKSTAVPAGKDVVITVKRLNPATALPITISFDTDGLKTADWTSSTIGWAFSGIDVGQKSTARYGTVGVSFIVGFPAIPADGSYAVDYNLWCVGSNFSAKPLSDFIVQASADGLAWRTLANYTATSNPSLIITTPKPASPIFSNKLQVGEKYVKWVYVTRDGLNVNVDDITVRQGVPTAINDMEMAGVS
ncbi:MAG: hypothetical protein KBH01_03650, partial [Breznakibacter sp.]|nr:hypothetical protein [Breznakibacter sp.]